MRLETPIGPFVAHFHIPPPIRTDYGRGDWQRRYIVAALHRSTCAGRLRGGMGEVDCQTDSAAVVKITAPTGRPFRRDRARAEALAKCMGRLGLNREERVHLWQAYFSVIHGPVPRVCVAVETRCPAGHRCVVPAITGPTGEGYFGSAREFCSAQADHAPMRRPLKCEQPTIESRHRYLYRAILPEGRRGRRQRQIEAAAPKVKPSAIVDDDF